VTSDGAPAFALHADASAVQDAVRRARTGLVDREVLTEVVALCAVAGEHLLVVGRREQRRSAIVLPNSWATQRPGPPRGDGPAVARSYGGRCAHSRCGRNVPQGLALGTVRAGFRRLTCADVSEEGLAQPVTGGFKTHHSGCGANVPQGPCSGTVSGRSISGL